ncbi:hypothetical protein L873DRAFT_1653754, partial [Choiromyces venosus 120613-1]
ENTLTLVLYRLSCHSHLKYTIYIFNCNLSWMSTVFNDVCTHICYLFKSKLNWDKEFLTSCKLEKYCDNIKANRGSSGLIWGFIDGSYWKVYRP